MYFKRILYYGQWERIFCLKGSVSFIFSLKVLLILEGDQCLKRSYFRYKKMFYFPFSESDSNGSSLLVYLNRIFQLILHSGQWKQCLVNYKPYAFIQSYFLIVDTINDIKYGSILNKEHYSCSLKPFFFIFADIPASGNSFSGQWKPSFHQILYHDQGIQIQG